MATEVVVTLRNGGGDYSTLTGFISGEARDLVAADEICALEVYNDWSAGGLSVGASNPEIGGSPWVTDADHYIHMRAADGHKHTGVPLDENGAWTGAGFGHSALAGLIWVTAAYTRITGLMFQIRHTGNSYRRTCTIAASNCLVEDCLASTRSPQTGSAAFEVASGSGTVFVNLVSWDTASNGCRIRSAGNYVLNCSFPGVPVLVEGNSTFINTLAGSWNVTAGAPTINYCASADDSIPDGTGNRASQTFDFEDASNYDYRLQAIDTGAAGHGTDLSEFTPFPFAYDMLGNPRAAPWDIGAFALPLASSPQGTTTVLSVTPTADGAIIAVDYSASDADGFQYQIGTSGAWQIAGSSTSAVVITGQNPLTNFQVRLAPYNDSGRGAETALIPVRTLADVPVYDKQTHSVSSTGAVTGSPIALPAGVDKARTYAIYRSAGGEWSVHALWEDWEEGGGDDGTPYDADLTRATASVQAKPVTVIESAPYVAELSAASFSLGGKPVTYQVITGYLAELSAAAFSVIGTAAFTSAGYVAQLGKAAFGLAAMPPTYTQAANYLAELTAAGFNVTAKVASTATGYVAQLGRATFSAVGKAAIWSGTFVADLTAAAFKAIGKGAEYETSLSYVAELTAALFKSSAAGVTIATAFVARLEAALMAVRARVVTFTRPDGADGEGRRLIGKTGRRRGRRM